MIEKAVRGSPLFVFPESKDAWHRTEPNRAGIERYRMISGTQSAPHSALDVSRDATQWQNQRSEMSCIQGQCQRDIKAKHHKTKKWFAFRRMRHVVGRIIAMALQGGVIRYPSEAHPWPPELCFYCWGA